MVETVHNGEQAAHQLPAVTLRVAVGSTLFNLLFYALTVVYLVAAFPALLLPRQAMQSVAKAWGRSALWLLRICCGITVEWHGRDRIPKGAVIVASKHQSMWETFALITLLADFAIVVKRELFFLPLFGWYMAKAQMIPLHRKGGVATMRAFLRRARGELQRGRQILIFPEGTRRAVGAAPEYKPGIAILYAASRAPCLPVAHNSGLVWPRRSFWRHPGVVRVEFLDLIPPGLAQDQFLDRLKEDIETATNRLIESAPAIAVGVVHDQPGRECAS